MSNLYKALQQAELEHAGIDAIRQDVPFVPELLQSIGNDDLQLEQTRVVRPIDRDGQRMVTISDRGCPGSEQFRLLGDRLRQLQNGGGLKTVLVTSGGAGEGKTTVAANLAVSLARQTLQKILLLEGDLRHPTLVSKFGLTELQGLREWFESQEPLSQFTYQIEGHQLWFLPAGQPTEDAATILQSERLADAMYRWTECFDWIVIDAPALAHPTDTQLWVQKADGVILVIRNGVAEKATLAQGLSGFDKAKLLGVVQNDTRGNGR
jgi:capsular exopolysaccharide synthesis family protein